ncbi:hypothetical protein ACIOD0_08135 [Kitasatospora albolonga]
MSLFKIDTSSAVVFVATPPTPKLVSKQTGEIAIDREAGAPLATVGLLISDQGEGNLHQVAAPSTGVPENPGRYPSCGCPQCSEQEQIAVASFRMVS